MGTTGSTQSKVRGVAEKKATTRGWRAALVEMFIILALYVAYSGSRLFASDSLRPAQRRAADLLDIESALHLSWEGALNQVFAVSRGLSLFGSFWYATAHYVVTAIVLLWLYRRGAAVYGPARSALVVGTIIALVAYLFLPTAPPRLFGGYADVLALTSGDGWWGGDASAPKGLGGMTNQLAAFPSLHAGWALWVAMVLQKTRHAAVDADRRLDARLHHRAGGRRHRQPLGRRRLHRVAGDLARLRADLRRHRRAYRPGASAPCAPHRDRSWPTWAAGWP